MNCATGLNRPNTANAVLAKLEPHLLQHKAENAFIPRLHYLGFLAAIYVDLEKAYMRRLPDIFIKFSRTCEGFLLCLHPLSYLELFFTILPLFSPQAT